MQVGLICAEKSYCAGDYERIHSIFGSELKLNQYAVDDSSIFALDPNDQFYIIVMVSEYMESILPVLHPGKPVVYGRLAFSRDQLYSLMNYPLGTNALLVSKEASLAMEAIALLYREGVRNIVFHPYYPGAGIPDGIDIAITPGYPDLIPSCIKNKLDIGTRTLDVQTIDEIIKLTGYTHIAKSQCYRDFVKKMLGDGAVSYYDTVNSSRIRREYDTILSMIDIGILVADEEDTIVEINSAALRFLGKHKYELIGQALYSFVPHTVLNQARQSKLPIRTAIVSKTKQQLNLTATPMLNDENFIGTMVSILSSGGDEVLQHRLIGRLAQKGHRAKYSFENILGRSPALLQTISVSKKMAFSDTAVLITGESGTGKELFAHSIHNSSNRSAHPFVAINCAAIPDTLLESELFGYEEGAFSGAKRGGKAGLFEIADKGTIFLDEINSMSTAMQIKLLRVMQEKEFMRVGGNTLIPIDVRIISATNQDLLSCVAEGQFRQDLYYRVSTLPIRIPPLRERGDDVFELIDAFCVELHCSFKLSDDAKKAIAAYTWPGNIRELRNCVEYLKCLNLDYIAAEHLPSYIHSALTAHSSQPTEQEIYTAIAALLAQKKCGRKTIMIALSGHGWQFSEAHIRQIMHQMKENGWISTNGGRSGSFLTQKGIRELISNQ